MCEVPLHGTMAHAFIQSFSDRSDLATTTLVGPPPSKTRHDFLSLVLKLREELGWTNTNEGELIAFIAYAQATRRPAAPPHRRTAAPSTTPHPALHPPRPPPSPQSHAVVQAAPASPPPFLPPCP